MTTCFKYTLFLLISGLFIFSINAQAASKPKEMKGEIVKINFVNKAGRENPDIYDLWFQSGNQKYFIKISESKVDQATLEKWVGPGTDH